MNYAKIAVLVSGGGTNLQALIDAQEKGTLASGKLCLVISNNPDAYALERAAKAGIPSLVIRKKDLGSQEAFEDAMIQALDEQQIDLIILAGFMSILSERFTSHYEKPDHQCASLFGPVLLREGLLWDQGA